MESPETENIQAAEKLEERDPNRGMSKKEKRRVEVLKERLEPRIEKLETQINEQSQKLNSLSDNLRREEHPSRGSFYPASPGNETSTEGGDQEGGDKDAQAVKTTEVESEEKQESPIAKLVGALQTAGLGDDPTALKLVADLAALNPQNLAPKARASHVIQPSGGGIPPAPDLRAEYEKRVNELRPGDIDGLMEIKRKFRSRGMEVW